MKSLIYLIIGVCSSLIVVGCVKNGNNEERDNQRELFKESVALLNNNIKQMQNAKDTATLDSIYRMFEESITDLNMRFPAETDFKMNESENDTLITLITRVHTLRDSLLVIYSHTAVDTVETNTETVITGN